jgi:hypothetical protein
MSLLGQANLAAGVETALYAPGAGVQADIQVIFVNRNSVETARVRVVHRPGSGPTDPENYIVYDKGVPPNDERVTFTFDVVNPEEVLVQSDIALVGVTANGIERTA